MTLNMTYPVLFGVGDIFQTSKKSNILAELFRLFSVPLQCQQDTLYNTRNMTRDHLYSHRPFLLRGLWGSEAQ